jgi:siderophore synthetase component
METLLNCYCREVAQPQDELDIGHPFGQNDWPQSVQMALRANAGSCPLQVRLTHIGVRVLTVVEMPSPTGSYRYAAPFFVKSPGQAWGLCEWHSLLQLLLREMAAQTGTPVNTELAAQIEDSVNVTAAILESARPAPFPNEPLAAFIESEQSLVFGHPFHPAPKSRQGVAYDDMLRYSPEMGARFPLHYFAIRREYLLQQSVLAESCDQLVAGQAPAGLTPGNDFALIPVHPWQARHLLALPAVDSAIKSGRILDLGQHGDGYYPTSSIRTLFHPDNPFFYKGSLNMRITNCVRKNATYELEGALQVTRLMSGWMAELQRKFGGLHVLDEPAYMSVGLGLGDAQQDKEVTEGFGLILRRNFNGMLAPGQTPLLAGALFGNHLFGQQRVRELVDQTAARRGLAHAQATEQWFSSYVEAVMAPVLYCYFAHGVIFEPHLQNVVIAVEHGEPCAVFLRDFEGVKLSTARFDQAALGDISPRARQALWYDSELGWKRIAYCLFVNNFSEAICVLGAGNMHLQQRLWAVVRDRLRSYQARHGDAGSREHIEALVGGEPFPGKSNLLNRILKRADRETTYFDVANPMGPCPGAA